MKQKLRFGITHGGKLLPWLGIFVAPVPVQVGDILITAIEGARILIRATVYADWADRIVCEWREK